MPEQSVHHREEADSKTDSDQQLYGCKNTKGENANENDRYYCTGWIQCRN